MVYQSGRGIAVSYAPEATFGVAALGNGASKVFRPNGGGINLTKEPIRSNENRRDGLMTRGRHGSRAVAGNYSGDLSLGSYDDFIQAVFRGTFDTPLALTGLTVTVDQASSTATRSAGSWLADGVRVGDVIRLGGFTAAAAVNNARNLRVTAATATVLTLAETDLVSAASAAGITLARPKKLLQGILPRSFTIEEAELDIDASRLFPGCRIGQMALRLAPNGMATVQFDIVGQNMTILEGAASPYFLTPVATASVGMTAVEAKIRLGTLDVIDLTALDLTINLNAAGQPVVGSVVTPDVFTNLANVEGTVTALTQDTARMKNFLNEDQLALHILFTENESEPKDFSSFFLGNLTLASATKSELGADGPRTQSMTLLTGADDRGGAYHYSTISYQTSAA